MKKLQLTGLSILSGLLLWAAWPVSPLTFLIFIAFIPLLYLADVIKPGKGFFPYAYLTLLTWNAITTYWLWNSTDVGAIAAIAANSLIMYLPWWGYRVFKKKYGHPLGYTSLVVFWMAFEYIHLNWQLSWPWLTLGNVFASHPAWVQWYEYTGTSGGTLWVLLVNILIYRSIKQGIPKKYQLRNIITTAVVFAIPFIISIANNLLQAGRKFAPATTNVVIVQPNIDPYNEKFDESTVSQQIQKLIFLSESQIDSNTKLVLWPETALPVRVWQDKVKETSYYQPVFAFLQKHPNLTLLTGIETLKGYGSEKATNTANIDPVTNNYFDVFNAAISMQGNQPFQFYDKSKLVPGVESTPDFLRWMGPVFEKFGGTTGGYGRSKESHVFREINQPYITAPVICYESIFGEYVTTYIKKGANIITIMTNDGWWGNTAGHKQHLQYARLRAIETRRWVARSANTGISAVIDDRGNILQTQPWDKMAVIKAYIPMLTGLTFYVLYGDILSKIALVLAGLLLIWHLYHFIKTKKVK